MWLRTAATAASSSRPTLEAPDGNDDGCLSYAHAVPSQLSILTLPRGASGRATWVDGVVDDTKLLYNEYIVYDTKQICTKFLCQVRFVFE